MCHVTLTFDVWIRVKVTAHCLNEDNICTLYVELKIVVEKFLQDLENAKKIMSS